MLSHEVEEVPAPVSLAQPPVERIVGGLETKTMRPSRGITIGYWIATLLFALQMGFTAYAQLRLPQVAQAFTHLGFPAYFRVELSWLKLAGIVVLLVPVSSRLKEWAYAGFAFTLGSALVAHLAVGDDATRWSWAAGTAVLWAFSYVLFRKLDGGHAPKAREVA